MNEREQNKKSEKIKYMEWFLLSHCWGLTMANLIEQISVYILLFFIFSRRNNRVENEGKVDNTK